MEETTRIFGIRTVIEAIQGGKSIDKIYIQKGLTGPLFQELNRLIQQENYRISFVPVEKLNKLATGNHQGVVANISPISFGELETTVETILQQKEKPLFLLLDQINDVRNFGAIIRTAECTGVDAIIIPEKGGAPLNADTVKTSAGGVFNLPIVKVNHIKDAVYYLQSSGVQTLAATEKSDQSIYETDLNRATAIIMGNEAKGVSNSVLKAVDVRAKLPLLGSIASLNVSVACGAILYETLRQRRKIAT
ncbi:23S rRNA (guanosine2251-2'-O)-methyltransferase [Salegentibacter echinorum]|uniref:23S rRNA (Guanosine2251-2'-O)-methyltransferase n=1 Tax=Salegentibacter echinorum TaxID=1073325 RepID=A0A1M5JT65_SALEC|nr:23S rRNA (guanosine(2251)-2'-O)-methyltransferase RlmB [Salegentibacter echinorum]SHG43812.1 23S rRNA (guanosine2251-2'-O)-methyltransferase [Salegentibacter echinorum]